MRYLLSIFFIVYISISSAQVGKIRGKVVDDKSSETLVGVTVLIKETATGAATDLDGQFTIDIPAGTYDLQISYISYQTLIIENINVQPGEITLLNDIRLVESTLELDEVVVTAEVIRT
ncbi:MAG: carboxypeptidase-like regulatory domain-containing protein, partial [Prolixibacteraceae bacterium]|nr:carboxypeptidase-like regulatory domain-containing protein [Prolixibacteraceae bacterium]